MLIIFISFSRQNFGFLKSFDILILVVLGGLGSMSGAVIAAILLTIISTLSRQLSGSSDGYL